MSSANAEAAFEAGASFAVTPGLSQGAVRCIEIGLPLICGALTPTEIIDVLGIGAMAVKISPAKTYGPGYFKELRGPLPRAPLVAVGGVDADSAHEYVSAGAVAIGVGSPLLGAAAHGDFTGLTDRVRTFFRAVHR
jgi:2-dehydro-3-deoxyphosphogluconate aldolase/(4S)-4-hydroxy-2-oxoglutarate aldolase